MSIALVNFLTPDLWVTERFVLDQSAIVARSCASDDHKKKLRRFMKETNHLAILEREATFIYQDKGDLFPVVDLPRTPLRRFADRRLATVFAKLGIFTIKEVGALTSEDPTPI